MTKKISAVGELERERLLERGLLVGLVLLHYRLRGHPGRPGRRPLDAHRPTPRRLRRRLTQDTHDRRGFARATARAAPLGGRSEPHLAACMLGGQSGRRRPGSAASGSASPSRARASNGRFMRIKWANETSLVRSGDRRVGGRHLLGLPGPSRRSGARAVCRDRAAPRHRGGDRRPGQEDPRQDPRPQRGPGPVTVGGREVVTAAVGESMTGVPATADMRFRIGSVGIAYLNILLLQLVDEGTVTARRPDRALAPSPHARRRGHAAHAGQQHVRLPDYESYDPFVERLYADPFQHWTEHELIDLALARPPLVRARHQLELLARQLRHPRPDPRTRHRHPTAKLLRRNVLDPLGLLRTVATPRRHPEPGPARLHHRARPVRGLDLRNPSWTTATRRPTSNICDLAVSARAVGDPAPHLGRAPCATSSTRAPWPRRPTETCPETICVTQTEEHHFGLGVIVQDGWIMQRPSFAGYSAVQTYLPGKDIAIAVATTRGPHHHGRERRADDRHPNRRPAHRALSPAAARRTHGGPHPDPFTPRSNGQNRGSTRPGKNLLVRAPQVGISRSSPRTYFATVSTILMPASSFLWWLESTATSQSCPGSTSRRELTCQRPPSALMLSHPFLT